MSARGLVATGAVALTLLAATAAWARGPAGFGAASAPVVQSMIVGSGGAVLAGDRTVRASATSIRVSGRMCAVAAGTPLAVLAALHRAGGPGFALRDYGSCGGAAVNSAQLYVSAIDGERGAAQSGWEYKVNGVSGSAGAADPSGPMGDGRRLRSGQRVLWFWCQASYGGCQRTLEVSTSTSTVNPGAGLRVAVRGFDNEGSGQAVAGAIVTLGTDFASTGSGGEADLVAPTTPGRYQVSATRPGLVPSFPQTIIVR